MNDESKNKIKKFRNELFDENFNCITDDQEKINLFCKELKKETHIQTCNHAGMMYEYIEKVYNSVINED